MDFATIFLSEFVGTTLLLLLGGGTVASTALVKSKGKDSGFLFVNWGWGLAVMMGVLVSYKSGGHLNPAVTFGLMASGVKFTGGQIAGYMLGQMLGALLGAGLCWLAYKQHFDEEPIPRRSSVSSPLPRRSATRYGTSSPSSSAPSSWCS